MIGRRFPMLLSVLASTAFLPSQALACAVCFGDPDSDMAKGATAGVMFMVGVTGMMLLGIAGLGLTWIRRSRQLVKAQAPVQQHDD